MVSPSARRRAVEYIEEVHDLSEHQACGVMRQARSTQRYKPKDNPFEERLIKRMKEISRENPSYGYPRTTAALKDEGWRVNKKRIQRLWRREGLRLCRRKKKKKTRFSSKAKLKRAEHPNHVWTYDLMFDQTSRGTTLKILTVLDEYTRECLAIRVDRRFSSAMVKKVLKELFQDKGIPVYLRSDNGSEFIARIIQEWLEESQVGPMFITPGSPWENPFIESFNGTVREECLNRELFLSVQEAKVVLEEYRSYYNTKRLHSSLGNKSPLNWIQLSKKDKKFEEYIRRPNIQVGT